MRCFQGQRLHHTPSRELESFGIFNGNHIMLIGQKVCQPSNVSHCSSFDLVIRQRG